MFEKTIRVAACLLMLLTISENCRAEITVHNDLASFLAASHDLAFEGFESARVVDGGVEPMRSGLDETTNNDVFRPGEIAAGVRFNTPINSDFAFLVIGANSQLLPETDSKVLAVGSRTAPMELLFSVPVTAVSMDLQTAGATADVTVSLFNGQTLLGSHTVGDVRTTLPESFAGFTTQSTITRVLVNGPDFEVVDDVRFGLASTAVPEPSNLIVLGLALACMSGRKRTS